MTGARRHAAYVTAKSALFGLTRSMAIDQGRTGIRVNAVSPGIIDSGRPDLEAGKQDPARMRFWRGMTVLDRLGPAGGGREPGGVPRFGRGVLYYRAEHRGRWRLDDRLPTAGDDMIWQRHASCRKGATASSVSEGLSTRERADRPPAWSRRPIGPLPTPCERTSSWPSRTNRHSSSNAPAPSSRAASTPATARSPSRSSRLRRKARTSPTPTARATSTTMPRSGRSCSGTTTRS